MKPIMMLAFLAATTTTAWATNCPQHYLNGQEPQFNAVMHSDREICYSVYAIGYHDASKTAFYSAEHLLANNVKKAKELEREDNFHPDDHIPVGKRAELSDFRGSGLDRGHLSPSAEMPTKQAQYESFSLANMVPELHSQNAGIWSEIESATRYAALREGDVFVVTGGIYDKTTQKIKGGIAVPNALFKAVYLPKENQAGVYVSDNDSSGSYSLISVADLSKRIGFDVFPSLSASVKNTIGELPAPKHRSSGYADRTQTSSNHAIKLLKHFLR